MPRRTKTPCRHRGCPALVERPGYCQEHTRPGSFADTGRGSSHQRGYGAAWQRLRRQVLRRDGGLCQPCKAEGRITAASEVDHVRAKAHGGTDDPSNLQGICRACHAAKTAREGRGGSKV